MRLSDAISFVRARMDEIAFEQGDMIPVAQDDRNLDNTIGQLLPEAVRVVVLAAPAHLLEPEDIKTLTDVYGSVEIVFSDVFLRLVYAKASDSTVYLSSAVPFNSPQGRMQDNEYVKGTPDAPVLVQLPKRTYETRFKYYSVGQEHGTLEMAYIKTPVLTDGEVFCPGLLEDAVYNELTAMVLEVYNDQRSQLFHQKVTTYLAQ